MRPAVRRTNSDPDEFLRTVRKELYASANDLRPSDVPDTAARVVTDFVEATAQGAGGCVSDWALWRNDWASDSNGSQAPINIWHGEDDPLVPPRHAQHLQRTCPRARLDVRGGEGHLHDDNTWRQVLTAAPSAVDVDGEEPDGVLVDVDTRHPNLRRTPGPAPPSTSSGAGEGAP